MDTNYYFLQMTTKAKKAMTTGIDLILYQIFDLRKLFGKIFEEFSKLTLVQSIE